LSIDFPSKPVLDPLSNMQGSIILFYDRIKEEIGRLLKANFIRPCKYAEWISNIMPVEKKGSGKIRICIDFRNLNRATPKDEYPIPIADMLINDTS
jgi:hypothetical protein